MKKLLLTLLISIPLLVQASPQNPVVYSALGNNIYNNEIAIEDLLELKEFQVYKDRIINYLKDVRKTKKMGFAIEKGDTSISKGTYLKKLRVLSKENDFFVKTVNSNFKFAIKNKDNKLFVHSIDSNLLDIKRYKKMICSYYYSHEDEISEYGDVLTTLIKGLESKKVKKKVYKGKTKQQVQDEKMRRIRLKDKQKQEAIQKALEAELEKKKANIRKTQKEELKSTSK